ncbi:MAG TPA: TlpA disulfide reductase family protein [Actinomycetota bacterium]|nr:TlpA disulfide reductase family protein [Actinomycetota bacterium]
MTLPRPLAVVRLAAALCVGLASCTSGGGGSAVSTSPSETRPAIVVADAPSIPTTVDALPTLDADGYEALLADVHGTPLVVNFWASWCEPCEREMPLLAAAAERHRDSVQFLGIDILDTPEPARAFLDRFDVPYPNLFDASGSTRDAVGSLGQPVTVFYDAGGDAVAKVDGELSPSELDDALRAIV